MPENTTILRLQQMAGEAERSFARRKYARARETLLESIALAARVGSYEEEASSRIKLATVLKCLDQTAEGTAELRKVLDDARTSPQLRKRASNELAGIQLQLGRHDRLDNLTTQDDSQAMLGRRVLSFVARRMWDEALETLSQSIRAAEALGDVATAARRRRDSAIWNALRHVRADGTLESVDAVWQSLRELEEHEGTLVDEEARAILLAARGILHALLGHHDTASSILSSAGKLVATNPLPLHAWLIVLGLLASRHDIRAGHLARTIIIRTAEPMLARSDAGGRAALARVAAFIGRLLARATGEPQFAREAAVWLDRAHGWITDVRVRYHEPEADQMDATRLSMFGSSQDIYRLAVDLHLNDLGDRRAAFGWVEKQKAAVLMELLAESYPAEAMEPLVFEAIAAVLAEGERALESP